MIFHMPNKHITLPILKISNTHIVKVNEFNFLGLTLDTKLDWKRHSNNTSNKISRTIEVLNKLKNVLPQHIKTIIYNTLILPHFNYCILCWWFKCNRVFALQKKAIRIITCNKYNAHIEPLFKVADLQSYNLKIYQPLPKTYNSIIMTIHQLFKRQLFGINYAN